MTASGHKSLPSIGFLTVREYDELGLIGAYLLLNVVGRPLEFHCTAPVRANRAQQILYGPTLKPFLYGEQIGHSLVSKAKEQPLFVCTDLHPVLAVRPLIAQPVVLVDTTQDEEATGGCRLRLDGAHGASSSLHHFKLASVPVAVLQDTQADRDQVEQRWAPYLDQLDLQEPFTRLVEAIDETQCGIARASGAAG